MGSSLFLNGMAIGFAIAAPVGPVGVLCIRRALADGRAAAFIAGLGAAVADTFYGAVAGFGLTFISEFLLSHDTALRLVGGSFICLLGWHTYRAHPRLEAAPATGPGLARDFLSTFLLTLTNPGTILAFMGVFAAMGTIGMADSAKSSALLITGVFFGSALWWLLLSAAAGAVRSRFTPRWLAALNRGSGALLLLFGLALLGSLLF